MHGLAVLRMCLHVCTVLQTIYTSMKDRTTPKSMSPTGKPLISYWQVSNGLDFARAVCTVWIPLTGQYFMALERLTLKL